MAESKSEKIDRLIADGAVLHQLALPDGGSVWRVTGDTGTSHRVVVDKTGDEWSCDCAYRFPDCSHAWAVLRVLNLEPPGEDSEGDEPIEILDVNLPVERIDENLPLDELDLLDEDPNVEPDSGTDAVESDTAAVLVAGSDSDIPDSEQRRDLIAIAEAPITWRTLEALAETEFVPKTLRGRAGAVLGAVLLGREYGLGPLEALRNIDVIDGSPGPNAELQMRLYRRAGHMLEVVEADAEIVILRGKRADTGDELEVSYSLDDAARAGLITLGDNREPRARSGRGNKMPWELYTAELLWARAVTRLVRRLAPDCFDLAP